MKNSKMVEVQFRKMTRDDVDEVYAIETKTFLIHGRRKLL